MNYLVILNKPIDINKDVKFNGKYIHLSLNYSLKHWDPYFDKENNIKIFILGRPTIDLKEWDNYTENETSYISKILINRYLKSNLDKFSNDLNGAFTILILDYNKNDMILVTDKLGMFPVYVNNQDNIDKLQIATHSDILANHLEKTTLDNISVAEFLKSGFINIPNTYYNEVKVLEHSSYFIWNFETKKYLYKKYFEFKSKETNDFNYLVDKLSSSLVNAIEKRTNEYYGKKAILLSGGADSRSILYNSKTNIDAITLYNTMNNEINTTKEITKVLNIEHHLIKRDFDHYIDILEESILTNGGMSEITSEHYLSYKDNKTFNAYGMILTGCYFDYMFKGLTLNTKNLSVFGKKLPYKFLSKVKNEFYVGSSKISNKYNNMLEKRENNFLQYDNLIELESKRFLPLHREHDAVMRHSMIRSFEWDLVSSDNDLIDCFLSIPPKYKINAQIFDKAIQKITNKIGHIPHANKKVKIGTHPYISVLSSVFRFITSKFKRKNIDKISGDGSWINFTEYAKRSEKVNNIWESIKKEEQNIIIDILGYNPWKEGKEIILNQNKGHHLFFRIIAFSKWHEMYRKDLLLKK